MRYREPADQFLADYVRHGMTPFFGLPTVDASDPQKAFAGCRVAVLGIPHDASTSQNPGARFAPYSVRRASLFVMTGPALARLGGRAVDGGNIVAPLGSPAAMRQLVQLGVSEIIANGTVPFLVGGDHSVALPAMRAMAAAYGPIAVVHVDAHPDVSKGSEFLSEDPYHHGTPLRYALEEGLIAHGQLHQIGIRCGHDEALVRLHGIHVYGMDEISDRGIADIMTRVRDGIGSAPTYVTFDIDAVDPAFAPGTGTPMPGGLSAREALRLVRSLAGLRIIGMDVVEVLPALDHADITSMLAASLLWEGIGALAG